MQNQPKNARRRSNALLAGAASRNARPARGGMVGLDSLESRTLFSVFTVTNNSDNTSVAPTGSLRWAINQSNNTAGVDTIAFNLPAGQTTIRPLGELSALWDPAILDATTQPGWSTGKPAVQIDGTNSASGSGLRIYGGNTVKGLAITNFKASGIDIFLRAGFGGNTIQGNWIGLDLTGAAAGNQANNIYVGTPGNLIGGTNAGDRNVVSGSRGGSGIYIQGATNGGNTVQGNYIGTDPTGMFARMNAQNGIGIQYSPNNQIIGNVSSGNHDDGIIILNTGATGNVVQGNILGLDATGNGVIGNGDYGIEISSDNNIIGGTTGKQRNILSGNGLTGVVLYTSGAFGNQILGNYIGTDITGNLDRGNLLQGVAITGVTAGNSFTGNLISGNDQEGIGIFPGNNTTIQGNVIGFAANGSVMTNATWAVSLFNGSTGNLIGGTGAGQGNWIADHPTNPDIAFAAGNTVTGNLSTPPSTTTPVPGTFALSASTYSIAENAGSVTITVTRSAGTTVAATVNYAASNGTAIAGSDFMAASGTLSFAAGETSKTFSVSLLNDAVVESGETFGVALSSPTAGATLGATSSATVTITNDDSTVAGAFAFSSATYSAGENAGTATITVTRTAGTNVAAAVNYATSNGTGSSGSDYTATSGTLSFAAGETSKTFTVALLNESTPESDETIGLTLTSPMNGATLGAQSTATLTITNDDAAVAGSFAFGSATYSAGEAAGTVTITVTRTASTNVAASVNYAAANGTATSGSDFTATSGTLGFAAGETSKTFTVAVLNDAAFEANETVGLTLSAPTGGATLGTPSTATLTIVSDDVAPDTVPPKVTGVNFLYATNKLQFTFSEDVSATLDANDFYIINSTTFTSYTPSSIAYNRATNVATVSFEAPLPNATYTAYLFGNEVSDGAGNKLDADNDGAAGGMFVYNFYQLVGDLNRSGGVDLNDLIILSNHYGTRTGMTYADGDVSGDGAVDLNDLIGLANSYGTSYTLPGQGTAVAGSSVASTAQAVVTAEAVVVTPVVAAPVATPVVKNSSKPVAPVVKSAKPVVPVVAKPVVVGEKKKEEEKGAKSVVVTPAKAVAKPASGSVFSRKRV